MASDLNQNFIAGRYYEPSIPGANGNFSLVANTMYAYLVDLGDGDTAAAISLVVTTLHASSVRVGYYTVGSDGAPGTLVADLGTFDVSSTGTKEVADTVARTGQLYLTVLAEGTPAVARADNAAYCSSLGGATVNGFTNLFTASQTYGALPASFPSASRSSSYGPLLKLKG